MLAGVPPDAYMVNRTLMTLSDEKAGAILRGCAAAMPDRGKVLAVEMVLPAGNQPSPAKTFDVLMLCSIRERASGPRPSTATCSRTPA
jgi:hypothetical protein